MNGLFKNVYLLTVTPWGYKESRFVLHLGMLENVISTHFQVHETGRDLWGIPQEAAMSRSNSNRGNITEEFENTGLECLQWHFQFL